MLYDTILLFLLLLMREINDIIRKGRKGKIRGTQRWRNTLRRPSHTR